MKILSHDESKEIISKFFDHYQIDAMNIFDVIWNKNTEKKSWFSKVFNDKIYLFSKLNFPKEENNFSQLLSFYEVYYFTPRYQDGTVEKKFIEFLQKVNKEFYFLSDSWFLNGENIEKNILLINTSNLINNSNELITVTMKLKHGEKFYIFTKNFDLLIIARPDKIIIASDNKSADLFKKEFKL